MTKGPVGGEIALLIKLNTDVIVFFWRGFDFLLLLFFFVCGCGALFIYPSLVLSSGLLYSLFMLSIIS